MKHSAGNAFQSGASCFIRKIGLKTETIQSSDEYPFCIPAIRNLTTIDINPKVTYFVGDNGTGKSTLLEAIAIAYGFNPEGGTLNMHFATRESHSALHQHIFMAKGFARPRDGFFMRAESFYNIATQIEIIDDDPDNNEYNSGAPVIISYGNKSLHNMSHGESFITLLNKRFNGNGLYLLDEPESALSPSKQLSVLSIIHNLVQNGSQFIIVTHSPIIMAYPGSTIYQFSQDSIEPIEYVDTEHYAVTKDFLEHRDMMLDILLTNQCSEK